MRRPWHRWRLYAVPVFDADDVDGDGGDRRELAAAFNREPEWFMWKRSALRRVWFYERQLQLPVHFYVLPAPYDDPADN